MTTDDAPQGRDFRLPELADLMKEYVDARADSTDGKADQNVAGKPIKDWLEQHPNEELRNGEYSLRAYLQEGGHERRMDFENIPDEIILTLARRGCLVPDWTAFDTWAEKAPWHLTASDFVYKIPKAPRLQVQAMSKRKGRKDS